MSQISPYLDNTDKSFPRQGKLNWLLDWHTGLNRITNTRVAHNVGYKTLEMKWSSTQILLHFIKLLILVLLLKPTRSKIISSKVLRSDVIPHLFPF